MYFGFIKFSGTSFTIIVKWIAKALKVDKLRLQCLVSFKAHDFCLIIVLKYFSEKMPSNAQESKNLCHPNPVFQIPESLKQNQLNVMKSDMMAVTQVVKKKASKLVSRSSKDRPLETRHKVLTTWQNRRQSIETSNRWDASPEHLGAISLKGILNEIDNKIVYLDF